MLLGTTACGRSYFQYGSSETLLHTDGTSHVAPTGDYQWTTGDSRNDDVQPDREDLPSDYDGSGDRHGPEQHSGDNSTPDTRCPNRSYEARLLADLNRVAPQAHAIHLDHCGNTDGEGLRTFIALPDVEGTYHAHVLRAGETKLQALGPKPLYPWYRWAWHASVYDPYFFVCVGQLSYFMAYDAEHGMELHVSDGSSEGTRMVLDLQPGPLPIYGPNILREALSFQDKLLFTRNYPESGALHLTDGSSDGTRQAFNLSPSNDHIRLLNRLEDSVYFSGTLDGFLFRWDGGSHSPQNLEPSWWQGGEMDVSWMHAAKDGLYFKAREFNLGHRYFWTDGDRDSIHLLSGILHLEPYMGITPNTVALAGNRLFVAPTYLPPWGYVCTPTGIGIFASSDDGSDFILTHDFCQNSGAIFSGMLGTDTHRLTFAMNSAAHGNEPWVSDGSSSGTHLLKDIRPGVLSSNPGTGCTQDGYFYFAANDGIHGRKLWRSDGSSAGTVILEDLLPGPNSSYPQNIICCQGHVDFIAQAAHSGQLALYQHDIAQGSSSLAAGISQPRSEASSQPSDFLAVEGGWLFNAWTPETYVYLLSELDDDPLPILNGAMVSGSLTLESEIGRLRILSQTNMMFSKINHEFFSIAPFTHTVQHIGGLQDWTQIPDVMYFKWASNDQQALLLVQHGGFPPEELHMMRMDGDSLFGPRPVSDIASVEPPVHGVGIPLPDALGRFFFMLNHDSHGAELWISDGSSAGSQLVSDLRPGAASSNAMPLMAMNDGMLFAADDGIHGRELWFSDGSSTGTVLLCDIHPGTGASLPENPQLISDGAGRFYLAMDDGMHGLEPWVCDGSSIGTRMLADINPGENGSGPRKWYVDGNSLWFSADDGMHGHEPWLWDGRSMNMLLDVIPGPQGSEPADFLRAGPSLVFTAGDLSHGRELWSSDGSRQCSFLALDLAAGTDSADPRGMQSIDHQGTILFHAWQASVGREAWSAAPQ